MKLTNRDELIHPPIGINPMDETEIRAYMIMLGSIMVVVGITIISAFVGLIYYLGFLTQ